MPVIDTWLYFGCHEESGHFLWRPGMARHPYSERALAYFDGRLAPQDDTTPYVGVISHLGGWGVTALSFWDYTIDKRPGSNSNVFAPSLIVSPELLLKGFKQNFPEVWRRLPSFRLREEGPR